MRSTTWPARLPSATMRWSADRAFSISGGWAASQRVQAAALAVMAPERLVHLVRDGGGEHPERRHAVDARERRLRIAQRLGGELVIGEVARDGECRLHLLGAQPQGRVDHRVIEPAARVHEPLGERHLLTREAAVHLGLEDLLENLAAMEIAHMQADDPIGRHLPVAFVDRVEALIAVIPADDRHGVGRALEDVPGQLLARAQLLLRMPQLRDVLKRAEGAQPALRHVSRRLAPAVHDSHLAVRTDERGIRSRIARRPSRQPPMASTSLARSSGCTSSMARPCHDAS